MCITKFFRTCTGTDGKARCTAVADVFVAAGGVSLGVTSVRVSAGCSGRCDASSVMIVTIFGVMAGFVGVGWFSGWYGIVAFIWMAWLALCVESVDGAVGGVTAVTDVASPVWVGLGVDIGVPSSSKSESVSPNIFTKLFLALAWANHLIGCFEIQPMVEMGDRIVQSGRTC